MLKTNRSLLKLALLSVVTFGIYNLFFLDGIATDMNMIAAEDGKQTPGVIKVILLSICTCGVYPLVWYYKLGNRMQDAGLQYGMLIKENGTTILLWMLLGSCLCGIGAFVALHIIIKNMNTLCAVFNKQYSGNV